MKKTKSIHAPDLTRRPPRSPRVRLGGYAILPRLIDKCRATIAGCNGEYHFNCPLDRRLLEFTGISAPAIRRQVASGKGDGAVLDWVNKNAKRKRTPPEIIAWSSWQEQRGPGDRDSREFFNEEHGRVAPKREDIVAWFDLLDVDDHVTFGGKP